MANATLSNQSGDFCWIETLPNSGVAMTTFLLCAVCAGVAAVIWALTVLHRHHKSHVRISAFSILLLLNDMLEQLLILYFIVKPLQENGCQDTACSVLISLWSASRFCGVYLQQMMVLESSLSLRHPFCSAHVFSTPCSVVTSVLGFAFYFLLRFFGVCWFQVFSVLPLFAVMVVSWIITYRTPPIKIHRSNPTSKHDYVVFPLSVVAGNLYVCGIMTVHFNGVAMILCVLIIDPLLCVIISREKLKETRTNPDTGPTTVQAEHSV